MPRFSSITFVTASIPSSDFLNHNEVIGNSAFDILAIKVVPSIVGSTTEVQVYERDTFLTADLLYSSNPFVATGFDPIQKDAGGVITEALRGFVAPYEDQDSTGEFHIKLINNDSQAKTYTVTLVYEVVAATSVVNIDDLGDVVITAVATGEVLKWDGANWINNTLAEAGIAATGHVHSAADITTGLLAIARGGTGVGTAQAAFDALSPVTTLGDVIFRDASNNVRLAGNTTTAKQFLSQTGTGAVSAAPVWAAIDVADITGGNVKNTGTPGVEQVAVWTDSTTIKGDSNLFWDAFTLTVTGALSVSGSLNAGVITCDAPLNIQAPGSIILDAGATNTGTIVLAGLTGERTYTFPDGDVTFTAGTMIVNTGTPVNNQLAIWTDATTIEGVTNLTWDGSDLILTGDLGIGGAPEASAGFELDSTTKAVLVSRLTTAERDALTGVNGMIIYNATLDQMHGRVAGAWVNLGVGSGGFVDVSGTPVAGQLAEWVDADTIKGVDLDESESTSVALVLS